MMSESVKERRRAQHKKEYQKDPERFKAYQKKYYRTLKMQAYEAYGGFVCVCCGETEEVFLCLDHINDDGKEHRKIVGTPTRLYYWLKLNEYPPIMQVLCFNCNNAKKFGTCPHKKACHNIDIYET